MVGGGPFRLAPGQWTDDTSMALCLAESLIECGGFEPVDQLERYVRWLQEGHLSSTGRFFDVGHTTLVALRRFTQTHEPYCGSTDPRSAGNGSIMRLAPVPLFYAQAIETAVARSGESSRTTHPADAVVDSCRYFGALIAGAATGLPKEDLLAPDYWQYGELVPEVEEVARASFKHRDPPRIKGSGYVVRSLEAALWALDRSTTFREGALMAVNLGNDADTTGAVYGQLAGALYGEDAIPREWRDKLALRDRIVYLAEALFTASA